MVCGRNATALHIRLERGCTHAFAGYTGTYRGAFAESRALAFAGSAHVVCTLHYAYATDVSGFDTGRCYACTAISNNGNSSIIISSWLKGTLGLEIRSLNITPRWRCVSVGQTTRHTGACAAISNGLTVVVSRSRQFHFAFRLKMIRRTTERVARCNLISLLV